MYNNKNKIPVTSINVNTSYEGERLETKIMRIVNNGEPITDGAPLIYTDRSEGVQPAYDIRTDRFEVAVEAMDKVDKSNKARREEFKKALAEKNKPKNDGGTEPVPGTNDKK